MATEIPDLTAPWARVPLVHDETGLFPAETMTALDEHYAPEFADKADADATTAALATKADASSLATKADAASVYSKADADTRFAPVAALSSRSSAQIPPPRGLKLVTSFKAGHGFTKTGAGTADLNKAVASPIASQCVEIVTDGANGGTFVTNAAVPPVNLGSGRVAILVWAQDTINLNAIQAYLGQPTGGPSKGPQYKIYTAYSVQLVGGQPSNSNYTTLQPGRWQWLFVTPAAVSSTVGTPDMSAVTWWRLRIADNSVASNTVRFGGFGYFPIESRFSNGAVCFGFDDGFVGHRTIAAPMLAEKGWAATAFPVVSLIGTNANYMTLAQLRELQDVYRWSVGAHAYDNAMHLNGGYTQPGITLDQVNADALANKTWLISNGFRDSGLGAFPGGGVSTDVMAIMGKYSASLRSSAEVPMATPVPDDPMNVRSIGLTSANPASYYTDLIDKAKAAGALIDFRGHGVLDSGATGIAISTATLQTIVDYCATVGIEVTTRDRINAIIQSI